MSYEPNIRKALVVLGPELETPEDPMHSVLLKRAVALAKHTGCELELFHVCHDSTLDYNFFGTTTEFKRLRQQQTDVEAARVAEIVAWLQDEGVPCTYEVRWDWPRSDAILNKAAASDADVLLKEAREHGYVLGITSNTDWELARRSPIHVWFVSESVEEIRNIVAAVGNTTKADKKDQEVLDASDVDLMQTASLISGAFSADVYPVNACMPPPAPVAVEPHGATVMPVQSAKDREVLVEKSMASHEASIKTLARASEVPEDNVRIKEGHPAEVIPEVAESLNADMILLGASTIKRLERVFKPVTVEPVMARTDSDIFVFRERDAASIPERATVAQTGKPKYDLTRAITHPYETFGTPDRVVDFDDASFELRERILQVWEYDIRASMAEENEGGPVRELGRTALNDIKAARQHLEARKLDSGVRRSA